ncbi:hypothetical protein [uncultured Algoriphagus sp.]|uniref:hypothetical protein n=1 Tax=Algoriphagus formosus TaxID=2007308 RepID=UPI0025906256|nr:hypothetical protein [uncultured Algoriphagus sp.]
MKNLLKLISFSGLAMTIVPPIFFYSGVIPMESMKLWMLLGMIAWMVSAPFWVNKKTDSI